MVELNNIKDIFNEFSRLKVFIIGDVMTDSYLWGSVERISPEAPVPVVSVTKKEKRPGGAANVAINVKALGATPVLFSVIGMDPEGAEFLKLMKRFGLTSLGIMRSHERTTTVKTRVIGNNHQLIRVDDEMNDPLPDALAAQFAKFIAAQLKIIKPDAVIFEDYDKGVLNREVIQYVIRTCKVLKIPIAVDPKKRNFSLYRDITLFKPNLKELREGLKTDLDTITSDALRKSLKPFRKRHHIKMLMVTLSEHGIFFSSNGKDGIIPAHVRNISDVSGAGDTVISVSALCMALGLSPEFIASLSNLAGGMVCEKVGVVPVDKKQLLAEAIKTGLR